ncbi:MAG: Maf-like protein [Flavobacteriales bacterium]
MNKLPFLSEKKIVLASKSPRRQELLRGLGVDFELRTKEVEEDFPTHLKGAEIALYLANKKGDAFLADLGPHELVITADTIVWVEDRVLNKASNKAEAQAMLRMLSGKTHEVITGVCLSTTKHRLAFTDTTEVTFATLSDEEIDFYIDHYQPFDKAGAYGIQEFIGYIGVTQLKGSYFNVVGLPIQRVYEGLKEMSRAE